MVCLFRAVAVLTAPSTEAVPALLPFPACVWPTSSNLSGPSSPRTPTSRSSRSDPMKEKPSGETGAESPLCTASLGVCSPVSNSKEGAGIAQSYHQELATENTGATTAQRGSQVSSNVGDESDIMNWSLAVQLDSDSQHQIRLNMKDDGDSIKALGADTGQFGYTTRCTWQPATPVLLVSEELTVRRESDEKQKTPSRSQQSDVADFNKSAGAPTVTDAQVQKLCDRSICNACMSMERLPVVLLRQHGTGDYECTCEKEKQEKCTREKEEQSKCTCKKEEAPPGAKDACDCTCHRLAQPKSGPEEEKSGNSLLPEVLDNISASANTTPEPQPPSRPESPSPIQVNVDVQVESTFNTSGVVNEVRQHLSKSLDDVKAYHRTQLELLRMGLQCRQQIVEEFRTFTAASRARQQQQQRQACSVQQPPSPGPHAADRRFLQVEKICMCDEPDYVCQCPPETQDASVPVSRFLSSLVDY